MFRAHVLWLVLAAIGAGQAAPAHEGAVFSPAETLACLASAAPGLASEACAGRAAARCMTDTQQGETTYGMILCLGAEAAWWDARLNASYALRIEAERAIDAEMAALGREAPSAVAALRDMQRAWIAFRDARCGYEAVQWMGGSGTGPAVAACHLRETARQTLIIEQTLAE